MHCAAKLRCLAADRKKTEVKILGYFLARAHSIPKYSGMSPFLFLAFRMYHVLFAFGKNLFLSAAVALFSPEKDVLLFFSLRTHAQMIRKPIIDQTAENGHCPRFPGFPYLFQTVLKSR